MTPAGIRSVRSALGITQGQAARLAGVDGRTWRAWEAGIRHGRSCDAPEPAVRLLRLMAEVPGVMEALDRYATR